MYQPLRTDSSEATGNRSEQYKELLFAEKARLQGELRSRLETLHSDRVAVEDQAPLRHEQFVLILQNNLAYERLKAIDLTLHRLSRGQYGICQECGDSIAEKRLKAIPWTAYCLSCQGNTTAAKDSRVVRQPLAA